MSKYIEVNDTNPFGEENVDEHLLDNPQRDHLFVQGYSDKRQRREEMIAAGYQPGPLEHRLHWVRAQKASGAPDGTKTAEMKALGYRAVQWDEAESFGLDLEQSAAVKGAGGEVQLGDLVLMVADKRAAATNYKRVQQISDAMYESKVMQPLQRAAEAIGSEAMDEVEYMGDARPSKRKR